jgi:uncharacterized membrane protein
MNTSFRLGLVAMLLALILSAPLRAHPEHQDNLSDEEMVMMEAGMTNTEQAHAGAEAHPERDGAAGDAAPAAMSADAIMHEKIEENRLTSTGDLLSRLHPVAAHFPVALLIVAALAEFAMMLRPTLGLQTTIRFLVAGGAIGAVVTALFGWFAGGWRLADRSETLAIHRWNGTTIAVLSLLAWWLAARSRERAALRVLLAVIAAAILVQGYYGGEMVHGPNHMGIM